VSLVLLLLVHSTTADTNSSCNSTQYFINATATCANCANTTGQCQDSTCKVFGFEDSATTNCAIDKCAPAYCSYFSNCSVALGQKCFGMVMCSDNSTTCGDYGFYCVQDGSSSNFKICGGNSTNSTFFTLQQLADLANSNSGSGSSSQLYYLALLALLVIPCLCACAAVVYCWDSITAAYWPSAAPYLGEPVLQASVAGYPWPPPPTPASYFPPPYPSAYPAPSVGARF